MSLEAILSLHFIYDMGFQECHWGFIHLELNWRRDKIHDILRRAIPHFSWPAVKEIDL